MTRKTMPTTEPISLLPISEKIIVAQMALVLYFGPILFSKFLCVIERNIAHKCFSLYVKKMTIMYYLCIVNEGKVGAIFNGSAER